MKNSNRIQKVQELVKEELGQIVLRELEIPAGAVVTLTRVMVSGNLQQARVYISVVPDRFSPEVMKQLEHNVYDIQQLLNERLRMRPVPRIKWIAEKMGAEAQHIEELLDQIKKKQ